MTTIVDVNLLKKYDEKLQDNISKNYASKSSLNSKQEKLSSTQTSAINSGITSEKVSTYDNFVSNKNYINNLSISGKVITYTKGDGTSGTITTQDTNTWNAFKGATSSSNGTAGYIPAPNKGEQEKYFKADGTWSSIPSYSVATTSTNGLMSSTDKTKLEQLNTKVNNLFNSEGHLVLPSGVELW